MSDCVFENENYRVAVVVDEQGEPDSYALVNMRTGVTEGTGKSLPQTIAEAEHNNAYLVNEMWQWIRKTAQAETQAMEESSPAEMLLN